MEGVEFDVWKREKKKMGKRRKKKEKETEYSECREPLELGRFQGQVARGGKTAYREDVPGAGEWMIGYSVPGAGEWMIGYSVPGAGEWMIGYSVPGADGHQTWGATGYLGLIATSPGSG
ncbi:unnamed protein product [Boreogadus saida]